MMFEKEVMLQLESMWFLFIYFIICILYLTLKHFGLCVNITSCQTYISCSYTAKFDKVELNEIVVSVSDLPEPEVTLNKSRIHVFD